MVPSILVLQLISANFFIKKFVVSQMISIKSQLLVGFNRKSVVEILLTDNNFLLYFCPVINDGHKLLLQNS